MWPCICRECSLFVNRVAWYLPFWFTNVIQWINFRFYFMQTFCSQKTVVALFCFLNCYAYSTSKKNEENNFLHRKWGLFTWKIGSGNDVCHEKASWCIFKSGEKRFQWLVFVLRNISFVINNAYLSAQMIFTKYWKQIKLHNLFCNEKYRNRSIHTAFRTMT